MSGRSFQRSTDTYRHIVLLKDLGLGFQTSTDTHIGFLELFRASGIGVLVVRVVLGCLRLGGFRVRVFDRHDVGSRKLGLKGVYLDPPKVGKNNGPNPIKRLLFYILLGSRYGGFSN